MADHAGPPAPTAPWTRPTALPPEGEKNFLDDHPFDLQLYALPDDVLVEDVRIPTRDGIEIAGTLCRPAHDTTPVPVIATATPYGKDRYDQWNNFRDAPEGNVPGGGFYLGTVRVSDRTAFEAPDPGYWVPNGYATLLIDLPGLGRSGSDPEAGLDHQQRWADVMDWLESQSWCTGDVGMSGVSALCVTQWVAAKQPGAPRQLKAIIPWEGFNVDGPGAGYGGIPETAFPAWLGGTWVAPNINPQARGPEPFLFDWQHDTASITVPALVCASFSDQELHAWDTFESFRSLASTDKWLYTHRTQKWGAYYGADELALMKRFLDRYLKGADDDLSDLHPVRLCISEDRVTSKVVPAQAWPPPNTQYRELPLDAATATLGAAPAGSGHVTIAPHPVDDPGNRAVFDHTFTEDTDVVGNAALRLFISVEDAEDADLFVGLEKLDRDGNEVYFFSCSGGHANGPASRGWLRASHRSLDAARSTEARPVRERGEPRPLMPGRPTQVDIAIMPMAVTFRAGETLRLVVQSWSTPGQWEGGETRTWDSFQTGRTTLLTGTDHPARLLLPVLPHDT